MTEEDAQRLRDFINQKPDLKKMRETWLMRGKKKYNHVYKTQRKILLEKENKCKRCATKHRLTVDHIRPMSQGGTHDLENLQVLCFRCHQIKNYDDNALTRDL